jgi:hypothetical protein
LSPSSKVKHRDASLPGIDQVEDFGEARAALTQ